MVVDSELVAEPKWLLEVEIVIKRQEVRDVESNSVDLKTSIYEYLLKRKILEC